MKTKIFALHCQVKIYYELQRVFPIMINDEDWYCFCWKVPGCCGENLIIDWCFICVLKTESEKTTKLISPYARTYIKKNYGKSNIFLLEEIAIVVSVGMLDLGTVLQKCLMKKYVGFINFSYDDFWYDFSMIFNFLLISPDAIFLILNFLPFFTVNNENVSWIRSFSTKIASLSRPTKNLSFAL